MSDKHEPKVRSVSLKALVVFSDGNVAAMACMPQSPQQGSLDPCGSEKQNTIKTLRAMADALSAKVDASGVEGIYEESRGLADVEAGAIRREVSELEQHGKNADVTEG